MIWCNTSGFHWYNNSQLYLIACSLSLWKCVKSATRGVLWRLGTTYLVFVCGLSSASDPAGEAQDATVDPLVGRVGDTPSPFFTQSKPSASQSRRLGSCPLAPNHGDATERLNDVFERMCTLTDKDDSRWYVDTNLRSSVSETWLYNLWHSNRYLSYSDARFQPAEFSESAICSKLTLTSLCLCNCESVCLSVVVAYSVLSIHVVLSISHHWDCHYKEHDNQRPKRFGGRKSADGEMKVSQLVPVGSRSEAPEGTEAVADIVYRFWPQKQSKFENFTQFTSCFLTSMFHGKWGLTNIWGLSPLSP